MIKLEELKRVARLARLKLSEEELKKYPEQFNAILKYFEQISRVETKGVSPLVNPTDIPEYLREDVVETGAGPEAALANAPERSGNLFKVPPVV